jgi:antitoxin (DNA-binding transcriptional repressor) of toxin-antitoxin stability system
MTTVTAKTLRSHLSQYLDRLEKGEEIVIIRHSEIIGSLKTI